MADVVTPVYGFTLPEVGASDDTWGTKLNADLQKLETLFAARWGGGTSATLGTYWKANQDVRFDGAKNVKLSNAAGQQEGAFGIDAAAGNVFLQKLNPASGTTLARLRLEADGAINANVGYFKGSGSGLTGIPDSALPANITATTVTATGLISGKLRHVDAGGYFELGAYSGSYGSGYGRIWWNETANVFSFQATDGNDAEIKATGNMRMGGRMFIESSYPTIVLNDTDSDIFNITGGNGFVRVNTANNDGDTQTQLVRIGTDGLLVFSPGIFTGNGSGLTSLPAGNLTGTVSASRLPTDSAAENWVGARIAGMAAQQLGTYCWLLGPDGSLSSGETNAGSALRFPNLRVATDSNNLQMSFSGSGPSGSWRAMQAVSAPSGTRPFAQFLRYA